MKTKSECCNEQVCKCVKKFTKWKYTVKELALW